MFSMIFFTVNFGDSIGIEWSTVVSSAKTGNYAYEKTSSLQCSHSWFYLSSKFSVKKKIQLIKKNKLD